MSYEKKPGYSDDAPPAYGHDGQQPPQYSWHGQSYGPPQDHPAFPPAYPQGQQQTQYTVIAPGTVTMAEPPPPDYMTRAIVVTICCFWPVGIFAIMKASESRAAYARGDLAGAKANSNSARQLSNIGIAAGIASVVIMFIVIGVYIGLVLNANLG